jgi:hypothetical protein
MALDREFERYHGGPNEPASTRIHVTMSPDKLILLNRNAYNLLGRPAAVYLNFSRVRDIIAIEPASPRVADSFPVIQNPSNWRINAAPFCRNFNIDIDTQLKFIRPEIEGDALMLKLNETVSVGRRKKRKKK